MKPESHKPGWVYAITNQSMPGLVKVGFTTKTPHERAKQFNGTANPHPFVVRYKQKSSDPRTAERNAHRILQRHRVAKDREWFKCTLEVAIAAIDTATGYTGKPKSSKSSVRKPSPPPVVPQKFRKEVVGRQPYNSQAHISDLQPDMATEDTDTRSSPKSAWQAMPPQEVQKEYRTEIIGHFHGSTTNEPKCGDDSIDAGYSFPRQWLARSPDRFRLRVFIGCCMAAIIPTISIALTIKIPLSLQEATFALLFTPLVGGLMYKAIAPALKG